MPTDRHCQIHTADRARPAQLINTSNGFVFVPFNYLGQQYSPPDVHLLLEARRFEYSFYYQQNSPWNFTKNHQKFVPTKWTEIFKLDKLIKQNEHWINVSNFTSSALFGWFSLIIAIFITIEIVLLIRMLNL